MSKKIYYRDQYKLNQILEQVKALSDVVDELRMALNDLKKASLNVNHQTGFFESTKKNNKVDYVKPTILRNMKTYFKNNGICTRIETYRAAKNTQKSRSRDSATCCSTSPNYMVHCKRKKDHKSSAHISKSSTIYDGLKFCKNKIIKNIQSIRKTRRSSKSTKHECVTSNQQEMCVLQKEEKQKSLKDTRNEEITKDADISEELGNSADTSFTSDTSIQTEITMCSWQENNKKLSYLPCRNVIENSTQVNPLSMISNDRSAIPSDRFIGELSKNRAKQTFLTNKIKKYKKCSCREQCPYALYKLPCNKYRCSTPEKKIDDEINELTLECLNCQRKNNFPTFINVDTAQEKNDRSFADFSPVKIGIDKSSISSLSVDLEVKISNDHRNSEIIDEFSKRRRARTYIVNKKSMRENDLIKNFRNETESSFNIISLWKHINEKKEKIDEIIENILSQKKYLNSEETQQEYQKYKTEDFINDYWLLKKNKQVQCSISALQTPILNKKISIKTSNLKFQQSDSLDQSCSKTNKTRHTSFPKTITPKWMNAQTQISKCSYFNYLENSLSFLDDYASVKDTSKMNEYVEKDIPKKNNTCIIEMDVSSSKIVWPRIKRHNIYSATQTREAINARLKESLSQTCDQTDWRIWKSVKASCPFHCTYISADKCKNPMSYFINYPHFSSKTLNFDMSSVSGRLYNYLEKLEDIIT